MEGQQNSKTSSSPSWDYSKLGNKRQGYIDNINSMECMTSALGNVQDTCHSSLQEAQFGHMTVEDSDSYKLLLRVRLPGFKPGGPSLSSVSLSNFLNPLVPQFSYL